ncbi:hypothetical protein [Dyadobacter sp. MSC1_007]|uniref:hypothetical protein n=1 Tax=Dyadobacter sp. MSC1_007 TaxID=2909264 RepID=UPI0020300A0E|nr:hypothetical protein [Dyadobacter sp. MSC1_007]
MKTGRLLNTLTLALMVVGSACQKQDSDDRISDSYFQSLKDNQARFVVTIGGKEFYEPTSVFNGQVLLTEGVLSMTLTNQFDGKTIINLVGEEWYAKSPVTEEVSADQSGTSLKIGKIVDRDKMIGEGYMMTKGEITATTFSKDKMIFKIRGQVGKYSDFRQPDRYLPFEGLIVYKKPAISFGDITEKEVFGSAPSR